MKREAYAWMLFVVLLTVAGILLKAIAQGAPAPTLPEAKQYLALIAGGVVLTVLVIRFVLAPLARAKGKFDTRLNAAEPPAPRQVRVRK